MIYYPIRTLVRSGITDILIVTSAEHCGHIIETLKDGYELGADLAYKIQDHNRVVLGIASALKIARNFTNDEPFAVVLGDNFFDDDFGNVVETFENQEESEAVVFLKEVKDIQRFGCATVEGDKVVKIVEKPKKPESNLAVTGLYFYQPSVYEIAETLKPSNRGELEITDINNHYCKAGKLGAGHLDGFWSDMGTPESITKTQLFILGCKLCQCDSKGGCCDNKARDDGCTRSQSGPMQEMQRACCEQDADGVGDGESGS
jgi:glucose-1-phosphate thymidylyltransferase